MGAAPSHEPLGGLGPAPTGPAPAPSAPDFSRVEGGGGGLGPRPGVVAKAMNPRASIRRSLRKRKEKRRRREEGGGEEATEVEGPAPPPHRPMDRLRRSFRDSFKRKKEAGDGGAKPHLWSLDEAAVRSANCSFCVKYLGCVEVFESRGMQVCEEALKVLRAARRRPIRGMLHVSGDGLRVVDDETKGLLVDQTIEKVSFCAPDRNHERGFSYICRDGASRRWMCHGFVAVKDTGERLSHAVGCAFSACLERKQKREKESVTMTYDANSQSFTRHGSYRTGLSVTERLADPQSVKPTHTPPTSPPANTPRPALPHAIARPHATPLMLQRQGSCRAFHHLNESSPFKRQLSLRINELPSNAERQRGAVQDTSPQDLMDTSDAYNNNGMVDPQPQDNTTAILLKGLKPASVPPSVAPIKEEAPFDPLAPLVPTPANPAEQWLQSTVPPPSRRPPALAQLRSSSLAPSAPSRPPNPLNSIDPFDSNWMSLDSTQPSQNGRSSTNGVLDEANNAEASTQGLIDVNLHSDSDLNDLNRLNTAAPPINPKNPFLNPAPASKAFEVHM